MHDEATTDGRTAAAARPKLGDEAWDCRRRRGDDGEDGRERQLADRAVAQGGADRLLVRVDGQDGAAEARLEEIPRKHRADRIGLVARADERDRVGVKERVQVAGRHDGLVPAPRVETMTAADL
jgi:hypothetical protein